MIHVNFPLVFLDLFGGWIGQDVRKAVTVMICLSRSSRLFFGVVEGGRRGCCSYPLLTMCVGSKGAPAGVIMEVVLWIMERSIAKGWEQGLLILFDWYVTQKEETPKKSAGKLRLGDQLTFRIGRPVPDAILCSQIEKEEYGILDTIEEGWECLLSLTDHLSRMHLFLLWELRMLNLEIREQKGHLVVFWEGPCHNFGKRKDREKVEALKESL